MDIAVQQAQQNCKKAWIAIRIGLMALAMAGSSAHAGIAIRGAPEPLLHDSVKGSCDPQLQSPGFVSGVDVNGNPVAPADLARAENPVPAEILVPLRSGSPKVPSREAPVIAMDGKALDPILNPARACPSRGH
jgi:hypothetical protein